MDAVYESPEGIAPKTAAVGLVVIGALVRAGKALSLNGVTLRPR
jgi:hypothetical protein